MDSRGIGLYFEGHAADSTSASLQARTTPTSASASSDVLLKDFLVFRVCFSSLGKSVGVLLAILGISSVSPCVFHLNLQQAYRRGSALTQRQYATAIRILTASLASTVTVCSLSADASTAIDNSQCYESGIGFIARGESENKS